MNNDFAEFVQLLAESSGNIIKRYFRTHVVVDDKSDGSPVTIADKKAEETMRDHIMRAFPTHGIIGEEFGSYQADAIYQWVLDPIDGTRNFVAGSFLFGTLIALLENGNPILGVIHHPLNQQLLIGYEGETRLNGEVVHIRPCARVEDALLLSSTHWDMQKYHNMQFYETLTRRAKSYQTWGDCHGYYLLATGYADVMLDPIMQLWDVAPLVPIIEGAGGIITDWYGNPPIGGKGTVATGPVIHGEIIRALNP